jgi:hypothetical protein
MGRTTIKVRSKPSERNVSVEGKLHPVHPEFSLLLLRRVPPISGDKICPEPENDAVEPRTAREEGAVRSPPLIR